MSHKIPPIIGVEASTADRGNTQSNFAAVIGEIITILSSMFVPIMRMASPHGTNNTKYGRKRT